MQVLFDSLQAWILEILQNPANEFDFTLAKIDNDIIPSWVQFDNAGIFKSPDDIETPLLGGHVKHTRFFFLYVQREFTDPNNRTSNDIFVEKLSQCVRNKNMDRDFPQDGRQWRSIEIDGGIHLAQSNTGKDERFSDYLIPLKIIYVQ